MVPALLLAPATAALAQDTYTVTVLTDDYSGSPTNLNGTAGNCPANGNGGNCSLRDAITAANGDVGSTVNFTGLSGDLPLGYSLPPIAVNTTIDGTGAAITIDGQSKAGAIAVNAGTVFIQNLTIADGDAAHSGALGGAIYNQANLTVNYVVFQSDITEGGGTGGAIYNSGTLAVNYSSFNNDSAGNGGAIYNDVGGSLTVNDCTFTGDTVNSFGGAIFQNNGNLLTVNSSTFVGNTASGGFGGGIYSAATGASLTVQDSTFSGNTASADGGGVAYKGTVLTLDNNIFVESTECFAEGGSTCPGNGQNGNLMGSSANTSAASLGLLPLGSYGGPTQTMLPLPGSAAICAGDTTLVPGGIAKYVDQRGFVSGTCADAGADQSNYITVTNGGDDALGGTPGHCPGAACRLRDAIAAANNALGGDIDFANGVNTVTIGIPTTATEGPSIFYDTNIIGPGANSLTVTGQNGYVILGAKGGNVYLSGMTFANGFNNSNPPANEDGTGGAIYNQTNLTVSGMSFTGNTATNLGGAIYNDTGVLTVLDSTFANNTSPAGSAIFNNDGEDLLTVEYSTFTGNTATDAGAIHSVYGAPLTVINSTLSGNTPYGINFDNGTLIAENDIFADAGECTSTYCPTSGGGNVYPASTPALAALGNYGGTTPTMIPPPGSFAICQGVANNIPAGVTTDQRGFPNTNSTYCTATQVDAGAVQTDYTAIGFNDTNYIGAVNVAGTTPAVIVSLTENGQNIGGVPVTLDFSGTGTATGTTATTVGGTGATFSGLKVDAQGSDELSVSMNVVGGDTLAAGPETLTIGAAGTVTTTTTVATPAPDSFAVSATTTPVTLVATVKHSGTAVTEGYVTFTVNSGSPTGTLVGTAAGPIALNGSGSTGNVTYTIPANEAAGTYYVTASYADPGGPGNYKSSTNSTETINITEAPTITFTVPNQTYSTTPFTVTATSNSSGTITYSVVSGPATISGNSVTMTGVGTVVLEASQAAAGFYTAGTQNATFTISAGAPTITFTVPNQTYSTTPFTVTATSNSTGAFTYSVVSGPATIAGNSVTMTGTGTVVLKASEAATADYTTGTQNATFTISAGAPTITFTVPNQTYSATPFTVTATSNSTGAFTYSVVSGPATISGNSVTMTGTGTVVLEASEAAAGDYAAGTQNATFTISAAAPTITFTVSNETYSTTPFTVTATSNSTGAFTYSVVSGPATISGNSVTMTGVGTVVLQASEAAAGSYSAGTQNATFTISAAAPTITFTVPNQGYSATPFAVTATSNSTGAFTYSVVSGPATVSGNSVTMTGVGTVVLQASEAATADYTTGTQNATFTISAAAPTITFTVPNQTYSTTPFTVSATSNSTGAFTYSVVSGPATISGNSVTMTGTGTVVLEASEAAAGNYTAGTQNATFTISAAAPTITFTVSNKTYSTTPFTVSATSNSTGAFTYSVVSGPATISGNSVTMTGLGTVVLQASQAAAGSYIAGTQNATFTISAAAPTITFTVPNQTYSTTPFTVTATSNSTGAFTYSVVSGPATISGNSVTMTGTGTVVLQASEVATADYTAGTQNATFTISAAAPTITFTVPNQGYSATPFTVTATSNSTGAFTYSLVSGPATVTPTGTVTLTGVGTVVLQASEAAAGNYTAGTQNATFTVSTGAPTITFTVPTQTYSTTPFTVSATSNSSGTITYSVVSGPATISGNSVTMTGVGTVVLQASQAAAGSYTAGTQNATFTISAAAPTITYTVSNKTYSTTPFTVTATSNSTGAFTYSVVSGPATISGNSVTMTGVGTVVLQASQVAAGSYTAGTQNATFTISAAAPTITFTVPNQGYSTTPFTVTATSNSTGAFTYSVVSGPATISGNSVTMTGTGTVVLQASQAAAGSYSAGTQNATFTISAAAPTITFTVPNRGYSATPFTVTATSNSTGAFTYSLVSGPATVTPTGTVTLTGNGTVVIEASEAAAGNYTAGTQNATFTVSTGAPTITFTVPNQTYSTTPFTVSATSNSSGAITYSLVSGPATVTSSGTVTLTGVGTVVLQASEAVAGSYTAGTQNATFTVSAEAPTINFTVPNQTYGAAPFAVTATSNSTGAFTYSLVSGPATVTPTGTVTLTGVGTVVLQASQAAAGDYTAGTQNATFTVSGEAPTITFTVPSQTYSTTPFTVSATSNSTGAFTYSVVSGPATISGNSVTMTGTGTVVLLASEAAAGNYTAGTQTATFTINAAGAPTITFTVPNHTYGDAPFTVSATSNSTGAFTYTVVSGPATISGATVTLTGAGTVVLKASQAAAGTYIAGAQTATFTVSQGQPTLSWTPASTIAYGSNLSALLNATASFGGNAILGGFAYTATPAGGSAVTVTASTVLANGTYTLAVTFTPTDTTDYKTATASSPLTVTSQTLTVTANNATRVYGVANPTFTGTITGQQNGDTFTESFATTATITSNVGTYSIVPSASGANLSNYAVVVDDGTLTVNQAASTTTLAVSGTTIGAGGTLMLTATVASTTTGTPTGTVSFYDGSTLLDTATLSAGVATYSTTSLATGSHTLTAVYSGDINFTASSTTSATTVTVAALDFTMTATPASQSGNQGATFTYQLAVAPAYSGTPYPGTLTFTATGLPTGATLTFTPSSVAANAGPQTVSMAIATAQTGSAAVQPLDLGRKMAPLALAFLLLPFAGTRRMRRHGRRFGRMICLLLLALGGVVATAALSGCGSNGGQKNGQETIYAITVTATSGTVTHTSMVDLTVE
jgi:CSLREA domain-containing protein